MSARSRCPESAAPAALERPAGGGRSFSATARFEDVPPGRGASFGVFRYDRPGFERGWHYHPEAELTLILESSGRRFVGDHIGGFEPGDLVLLGPGLPHCWRNADVPLPGGGRARSVYVQFRPEWLAGAAGWLPELDGIRRLLARAARGLAFSGPEREEAAREVERLPGLRGLRRLVVFWELLQGLADSGGGEPLSSAGFAPVLDEAACARIRRIHQHVYRHFRGPISHRELARLAGLTPAALSKFFRRTTGRTVTEFVNEVRVGEAARRLIDTSDHVCEVAFASGFESLAHFNTTFRRIKQITPSRFRGLHRRP